MLCFNSKKILLEIALLVSTQAVAKTQCFFHLRFNSTSQLIIGISGDLQKFLRDLNDTAIVTFTRIPFAVAMLPINLLSFLKDYT